MNFYIETGLKISFLLLCVGPLAYSILRDTYRDRQLEDGGVGHCPRCSKETPHRFREGKERMYCICKECGHYNDDYADQYPPQKTLLEEFKS